MSAFISGFIPRNPSLSFSKASNPVPRCALEEPPTPVEAKPAERTAQRVPVALPRRKSNVGIVLDKATETVEDVFLHYSRLLRPKQKKKLKRPRIVILGSGWSAHALIKVIETEKYDVTLISPRNFFFFTPLLTSSSVGTVEFRSLVDPIRKANEYVEYLEAQAVDIDVNKQIVKCESSVDDNAKYQQQFTVEYDHLVVSVGARTSTFGVPGVMEHAFFLKELKDGRKLRAALIDRLERACLPSTSEAERERLTKFVVVGGGPTGCELAGELADFVEDDLRRRYKNLDPSLTLLQSGQSILTTLEEKLQQKAIENFRKRNINLVTGARVVEVTPSRVYLKDGRTIPHGLCIWATGNGPRPLVTNLIAKIPDQQKVARNKLVVDSWLRVVGAPRVYALGDCAEDMDDPLPATAQVAGQQGAFLARFFNKVSSFDGEVPTVGNKKPKPAKSFQFLSLGTMSYIGQKKAVLQVDTSRDSKLAFSGFLAYLLWSSVYLTKQVSFRSRVLVLFDWVKSQVFGRDVSRF